jgi:hypothetical protein
MRRLLEEDEIGCLFEMVCVDCWIRQPTGEGDGIA